MNRYGKRLIVLVIAMGLFLFLYVQNINNDRSENIQQFFKVPEPGDIYKIRYKDEDNNTTVRYFKVAEQNEESVFFYRGRLSAWNLSDVFLDDYDTEQMTRFSKTELEKIRAGQFSNNEMKDAELVEIERKKSYTPANSL